MQRSLLAVVTLCLAGMAQAQVEWVRWSNPAGSVATGSLSGGRSVQLSGFYASPTPTTAEGGEYTASPAVPGRADGINPPFIRPYTGALVGGVITAGALIATMDFGSVAIEPETVVGLGDLRQGRQYRIELRDAAGQPLPLAALSLAQHNLVYTGGLVADLDVRLDPATGALSVDSVHDAGSSYRHSGLLLLGALPAAARQVLLFSAAAQEAEGIQVYAGTALPPPLTLSDSAGASNDRLVPFDRLAVGSTRQHLLVVGNPRSFASHIRLAEGVAAPFELSDPGGCNDRALAPGAECAYVLRYAPTAAGPANETLSFDLDGSLVSVATSGTATLGTATVTDSIAPADDLRLPFGAGVLVGTTASAQVTVTNTDSVDLVVRLAAAPAAPFSIADANACHGVTLAPRAECVLVLRYAPVVAGPAESALRLSVGGAEVAVALSGNAGTPQTDLSLTLQASQIELQPGIAGADRASLTLRLRNSGPASAEAVVQVPLPAGLGLVSATADRGSHDAAAARWRTGLLASGDTATLELVAAATLPAAGCATVTASLTAEKAEDTFAANNQASVALAVPACADLRAVRVVSEYLGQSSAIGYEYRVWLEVLNQGPGRAIFVRGARVPFGLPLLHINTLSTQKESLVAESSDTTTIPAGATGRITLGYIELRDPGDHRFLAQGRIESDAVDSNPADNEVDLVFELAPPFLPSNLCFIATAAFGTPMAAEVQVLRDFRDRRLLPHAAGRAFVDWYYRVSPPLADAIRERPAARAAVRWTLTPLVWVLRDPADALLMLAGCVALGLGLRRASRRPPACGAAAPRRQ